MEKAIIFDCDGVLVDSEIIYSAIERKYLSDIGLTYTDYEYQSRFVGLTSSDYIKELRADFHTIYRKSFPTDFENLVSKECSTAFETELKAIIGAADFIEKLNCPIAVASSSELEILNKKLTITGLLKYFDTHIYSGAQVPKGKPEPDIFLFAANKLGVVPNKCIVIEDSANGIVAGLNAGMKVWGFLGGSHTDPDMSTRLYNAGANQLFKDFTELSNFVHLK